jgi:hypothetical protein
VVVDLNVLLEGKGVSVATGVFYVAKMVPEQTKRLPIQHGGVILRICTVELATLAHSVLLSSL